MIEKSVVARIPVLILPVDALDVRDDELDPGAISA